MVRMSPRQATLLTVLVIVGTVAVGLPAVTEYPTDAYLDESLQRSTAGAVLNGTGYPTGNV